MAPKASASAVDQSMPSPELDRLAAVFEKAHDRLVGRKILRHLGQLLADLLQRLDRHGGLAAPLFVLVVGCAQARPGAIQPVGLVGLVVLADLEFLLEMRPPVGLHLVEFGLADVAFGDQPVGIDLHRRLVAADVAYMIGWVKAGSSPSLWPKRR